MRRARPAYPEVPTADDFAGAGYFRDRYPQLPVLSPDYSMVGYGARQTAFQSAPLGDVPGAYDVRSVYDSRPVNAADFNICTSADLSGVETTPGTLKMTVPRGYVAVLRRVRTAVEPAPAISFRRQIQATLTHNGATVPNQQSIFVGAEQDSLLECWVIADELDTLGVNLSYFETDGTTPQAFPADTVGEAQFYGQLLVKTGRSINYEIANPCGQCGEVTPPPLAPPAPAPAAPVLTAPPVPARVLAPLQSAPAAPVMRRRGPMFKPG